MHSLFRRVMPLLLAVAIASPAAMIGCRPQEIVKYNLCLAKTRSDYN
jgi:hypothetical protein